MGGAPPSPPGSEVPGEGGGCGGGFSSRPAEAGSGQLFPSRSEALGAVQVAEASGAGVPQSHRVPKPLVTPLNKIRSCPGGSRQRGGGRQRGLASGFMFSAQRNPFVPLLPRVAQLVGKEKPNASSRV